MRDELTVFTFADYAKMYDQISVLSADYRASSQSLMGNIGVAPSVPAKYRMAFDEAQFDNDLLLGETIARADEELGFNRENLRDAVLGINHDTAGIRSVISRLGTNPALKDERVTMQDLARLAQLGEDESLAESVYADILSDHAELKKSRDLSKYSVEDHTVAEELWDIFHENGFQEITIASPKAPRLYLAIEPVGYGRPEYFLVNSNAANVYGSESLVDVAHTFNTLPEIQQQARDEERRFREFAEKEVYGRTEKQWDLSARVAYLAREGWYGSGVSYPDHLNKVMPDVARELQLPLAVANDAMALSENASMFSDWSKDLHGRRDRDYGESAVERADKRFGGLSEAQYDAAFAAENPGVPLRDRAEVYEAVDKRMHTQEVRDIPYFLVDGQRSGTGKPVISVTVPRLAESAALFR